MVSLSFSISFILRKLDIVLFPCLCPIKFGFLFIFNKFFLPSIFIALFLKLFKVDSIVLLLVFRLVSVTIFRPLLKAWVFFSFSFSFNFFFLDSSTFLDKLLNNLDTVIIANNDSNIDDNIQSVVTNDKGSLQAKKYNNWNYYLYVPDSAKTSRKPLVVFLHGSGERGTDISKLENYGFAKYIKKEKKDYDTYILMPQLPSGSWDTSKLMTLINKIVSENNVDRSRISISGFSLGTVPLPSLIEENPRYFSAVVFIASCTDGVDKVSYFRNTPTRLYHGGSDSSCRPSHSQEFADALKKNNGNVNLFILPNRPHNIVNDVFKDGKVISWMTAQRR